MGYISQQTQAPSWNQIAVWAAVERRAWRPAVWTWSWSRATQPEYWGAGWVFFIQHLGFVPPIRLMGAPLMDWSHFSFLAINGPTSFCWLSFFLTPRTGSLPRLWWLACDCGDRDWTVNLMLLLSPFFHIIIKPRIFQASRFLLNYLAATPATGWIVMIFTKDISYRIIMSHWFSLHGKCT